MRILNDLSTPCIGICSTIYGDDICRGCKRHFVEVIDWNTYSNQQKENILLHLQTITEHVVAQYLKITDIKKLKQRLQKHQVDYREEFGPLCWAYSLLQQGAEHIRDLHNFGLCTQPDYHKLTVKALADAIDEAIYHQALSYHA